MESITVPSTRHDFDFKSLADAVMLAGGKPGRQNWLERRQAEENFEGSSEPTVLILGTALNHHHSIQRR